MTAHSTSADAPAVDVLFKLGGSLLEWGELPATLGRVLERESPQTRMAIVVGGGAAANAVRRWDEAHGLDAASAHRLAIAAMDFNARLIRELLWRQGHDVITRPDEPRAGAILIPDMAAELSRAGDDVPTSSWEVTSDALAAWLARRLRAKGIVLLKSTDPPEDRSLATATARQLVDPRFVESSRGLQVAWINLRGGTIPPTVPMIS